MTLVAAFRDYDTGDHLLRLRAYSQELAEELRISGPYRSQIDEAFLRRLYRASTLHDVGKVAVPDGVLKKPAALTESEVAIVNQHTVIGHEMLKLAATQLPGADYMHMAAEIARFHHERFDGSGYPDGLSGTDIPLAARIVAVADVFESLSSSGTHKPTFPTSEIVQLIEAHSGTHFDPAVVEAFRHRVTAFTRIHKQFSSGLRVASATEP
jgi:putative two-component system response regulator